jgi:hypothetical protein
VLLTEVGPDLSRFVTAAAFCSWLRLCPEPKISGGQVLSSRTRPTKNRAALALRLAAQALHGESHYRSCTQARRIVYHLLTNQLEYDATIFQDQERRAPERKRNRILSQARDLGLHLVSEVTVP